MLHGILHQREQYHGRTRLPRHRGVESDGVLQPVGHAHLHDLEVRAHLVRFRAQRAALRMHARHGGA